MAGSKNNIANKKPTQHIKLKLSSECNDCIAKTGGCEKGKKYVHQVEVLLKSGNGVVCPK